MSTQWIILLGLVIVLAAGGFAFFVGVGEASDPEAVPRDKVPRWERKLISMRRNRRRQKLG